MTRTSPRHAPRFVLAGGLVVALLGVAWWGVHHASPHGVAPGAITSPAEAGAPSTEARPTSAEPVADAIAPAPSPITMPPAGLPLPDVRRQLERAAREGHAGAACRIAVETMRCLWAKRMSQGSGDLARPSARTSTPSPFDVVWIVESGASSEAVRQALSPYAERAARCGSSTPAQIGEALRFLRGSALAGVRDAQRMYGLGEPWWLTAPGAMAHPAFDAWLQEAPAVLAAMLASGDPLAPGLLASAYGGETWTSAAFPLDRERAATYALLAERIAPPSGSPSRVSTYLAPLSTEARDRAKAEADRIFGTLYGGRLQPDARAAPLAIFVALADSMDTGGARERGSGRAPCGPVDIPPPRR